MAVQLTSVVTLDEGRALQDRAAAEINCCENKEHKTGGVGWLPQTTQSVERKK